MRLFRVKLQAIYAGCSDAPVDYDWNVVAEDGEAALAKAKKRIPMVFKWEDDEIGEVRADKLARIALVSVNLVADIDIR
jgi:hypothetical protein